MDWLEIVAQDEQGAKGIKEPNWNVLKVSGEQSPVPTRRSAESLG